MALPSSSRLGKVHKRPLPSLRSVGSNCFSAAYDYSTTASLTDKNIVVHDDGAQWIETHRVKTGTVAKVKLLDIPLSIIEKYRPRHDGNFLLPVMSNAKCRWSGFRCGSTKAATHSKFTPAFRAWACCRRRAMAFKGFCGETWLDDSQNRAPDFRGGQRKTAHPGGVDRDKL